MCQSCQMQTNIFHTTDSGLVRCFTKYKMKKRENEIKIYSHGISIDEIIAITDSKTISVCYNETPHLKQNLEINKHFTGKLYSLLHTLEPNVILNIPESILPEEEYTLRINYKFKDDLNNSRIVKKGQWYETFCIPQFPRIFGYNGGIETIYIHKEDKIVFAPGLTVKKAKVKQNLFITNTTRQNSPTPFVVGNFKINDISYNNVKCKIYLPSLYNIEPELRNDINLACQYVAENFTMEEFNIKIIFMYSEWGLVSENSIYFPMSIFPMAGIDQNMYIREKICEYIAKIVTLNLECFDFWLEIGIKEYITASLLRCIFGENEIQFRSKKDLDFVMKNDIYEPSLIKEKNKLKRSNLHKYYDYNFDKTDNFKRIKARLLFNVLENNLSRAFMEKIIHNVIKMPVINTTDFIRIVKDISGFEMAPFFHYYVYRPGLIEVKLKFEKDKKGKVDVFMTQRGTSRRKNGNSKLFGDFTFKVFEQEGVFEYKFTGDRFSFQCHFRTKKRKTEKEMLEAQKLQGKNTELIPENIDEDEHYNMQSQILFMRADPNFLMLASFYIEQPDFMYIEQLLLEKNVYAQIDAINALSNKPSDESTQALERILNDTHVYYKIRIYILHMFAEYAVEHCDEKISSYTPVDNISNSDFGYQKIIQNFVKRFCIPGSTIPKANEFFFMSSYFIQKNSTSALVSANPEAQNVFADRVVKSKNIITAFLANILKFNSTEESIALKGHFEKFMDQNYVSHGNYIAAIIENVSYQLCSRSQVELDSLIAEFERLKLADLVFPSHQNLITASILKAYLRLCFFGYLNLNLSAVIQYTEKHNFISVREAAFDIMCICFFQTSFEYLKEAIEKDTKHIKLYILNSIKIILQMKDGRFFDNKEYNDAFNTLADIDINFQQRFDYRARYGILHENEHFFYELLQTYYYDQTMMEVLTDIIFLLNDKTIVYADDEEIVTLEQDSFIVKIKVNNLVKLKWPEGLKHDLGEEIKRTEVVDVTNSIGKEKSKYLICLVKLDTILLQYDEFIHKYYNILFEYKRKQSASRSKESRSYLKNDVQSNNDEVQLVDKNIELDIDPTIRNIDQKNMEKRDNPQVYTCTHIAKNYDDRQYYILKKLFANGKITPDSFDYNDFLVYVINKNIKKHKYFSKLNIKIINDPDFHDYKRYLHSQFRNFYLTQKYGSHLYLNAKALENVIEGLYLEYNLFEPCIYIDEVLREKCFVVLNAILTDSRSVHFIEHTETSVIQFQNYNDIIRVPMCLDLIKQRLADNKMVFLEVFVHYIELTFANSMEYNDESSEIYKIAGAMLIKSRRLIYTNLIQGIIDENEDIEDYNLKTIDNIIASTKPLMNDREIFKLTFHKKSYKCVYHVLKTIIEELMTLKEAAQYISPNSSPEYVKVIKKPMCIEKMHNKILNESYVSIGHILHDMNLIIKNCIAFNGNSSWVVRVAKKMENHFKREILLSFGSRFIFSGKRCDNATIHSK